MAVVYDNWERLVAATLRREELRLTCLRTPSELSSVSASSPFSFSSNYDQLSSLNFSSLLVGDSFSYHQILKATDFLDYSNLIKHGKSGDLYFGVLENDIEVVVKKFNVSSWDKEFRLMSEMKICGMVHHSRLIPLLGHCLEKAYEKFMVYKYMPNKDLSRFFNSKIGDDRGSMLLDWITRLKIAIGAAEGLCYLHHECFPPLVHRDIQARSILLDDEFEVQLGSLNGVCIEEKDNNQNRISRFLGLKRWFEQSNSGAPNATCAYDVYCFGKILLELVTGKLGISAVNDSTVEDWMASTLHYIVPDEKKLIVNIVDSTLIVDERLLMEIWAVAFVAKACLSPKPSKRPRMAEILKALESTKLSHMTSPGSSTVTRNPGFLADSGNTKVYTNGEILARPSLRIFTYLELEDATRNFETLQGEDEFGTVYRGVLHKKSSMSKRGRASVIAVKRMHHRSEIGLEQWQSEVEMLGRLSHPNILKLLGYCLEDKAQFLVYEFMEEGSLKNPRFRESSAVQPLTLNRKVKILIGAARGLAFLHALEREGFFQQKKERGGFYGYFKCSKILIDSDYNAKITGFGVAEVHPAPVPYDFFESHPIKFARLDAYAAPEYLKSGKSRLESDVYGFGAVLVRFLTGSERYPPPSIIEPVKFIEEKMDRQLKGKFPSKAATRMAALAQLCLQYEYENRPSMEVVVKELELTEKEIKRR